MKKLILISLVIFFTICSRSWANGLDNKYLKCNYFGGSSTTFYSFFDGRVTMDLYLNEDLEVKTRMKSWPYTMNNYSLNWTVIGALRGDKIYYSLGRKDLEMTTSMLSDGNWINLKEKCVIIDNYTEFYKNLKEEWKKQREGNKF